MPGVKTGCLYRQMIEKQEVRMSLPSAYDIKNNKPQKKLISFWNYDILDNLIKDKATYDRGSESSVIEQILLDYFFENIDPNIANIIVRNLWNPRGITQTCSSIFKYFASQPQYAPPELLDLLRFCLECEQRHMSESPINETSKNIINKCLQHITDFIDSKLKTGDKYWSPENDEETFYDVSALQEAVKDLSENSDQTDLSRARILNEIYRYWYVGTDPVQGEKGLQNNKWTYSLLTEVCNIADWPDIPAYRYQLLMIAKTIKKTRYSQKAASDSPNTATIQINLSSKSLKVSPKTIILQDQKDYLTRVQGNTFYTMPEYTEACILTHCGLHTDNPVIFLFNGDIKTAEQNAVKLIKDHFPSLFSDVKDMNELHLLQILFGGQYTDSRVKWITT